jgi:predicted nucleotidyltransferase
MEEKIHKIVRELKTGITSKYTLNEFKVFGSSARGDRRIDSDIDIFVLMPFVNRQIEEDLFDIAYDLELKYDCLIDIIVFDDRSLADQYASVPIYQKVLSEGLSI